MKALEKVLRFGYGETLSIGTKDGECSAIIAVLYQLQFVHLHEMVEAIRSYAVKQGKKNLETAIELLKACTRYVQCSSSTYCELNRDLASVVFSRENLHSHYKEVVDGCLMDLSIEYFEMVEYGEPQTMFSEYSLKMKYLSKNSRHLSDADKEALFHKCDWTKMKPWQLRELGKERVMSPERIQQEYERAMDHWEGALKECEEVKKKTTDKAAQAEKEKEMFEKLLSDTQRERDSATERAVRAESERDQLQEKVLELEGIIQEEKERARQAE